MSSTASRGAPPQVPVRGPWLSPCAGPDRGRLAYALLLSLSIHALLLCLTFRGEGSWLLGFSFPWQDRRIEVPELRVALARPQIAPAEPAVAPAEPLKEVEPPVGSRAAATPSISPAPSPGRFAGAIAHEAAPATEARPRTDVATGADPARVPARAERQGDAAPAPIRAPDVIAVPPTDEPAWTVPTAPAIPTPAITAVPSLPDTGNAARAQTDEGAIEPGRSDPAKQEAQRQAEQMEATRQEIVQQEAARVENARRAAERDEAARVEAARVEAAQAEATRAEAARAEAARAEAARAEAAQAEAARAEAARAEAARAEAARAEAARAEAARAEAARAEAARAEAARAEAARIEAARAEAQQAEAKREERLRAIGRQLDEEAARRDAAARQPSSSLPYSLSTARRYRLLGRADPNEEIIRYAEAFGRKIEMNMTLDIVREAVKQPHTDPLVTVAIRSDGTVESVTFVQSSGVAAIDEAVRRIVDSQKPYQAFPPALARDYDVIEIRRTWHFDVAIRLY